MTDSIKIKLSKPIVAGDKQLHELELRASVSVADLEAMDEADGEVGKSIRLLSALAGVPAAALREMTAADFVKANEALAPLLGSFPLTGKRSRPTSR